MTRTHLALAGSISVVLGSCLGAALVQTSCGRVRVYDINIPTQNGQWVVADLFKPRTATRDDPAPLVVVVPGFQRVIFAIRFRGASFLSWCCVRAKPSINTDWLTAGFARLQPAGYVRR